MKELNLKAFQLVNLKDNLTVLSNCPTIPFLLANKIMSIAIGINKVLKPYKDQAELLNERKESLKTKVSDDLTKEGITEEDKKLIIEEYEKSLIPDNKVARELNNTIYNFNFSPLNTSEFLDISIDGEKIIPQQQGESIKFSYRDAYFIALEAEIIES